LGKAGHPGVTVEEFVQLQQLQLDGGDGGVHLRPPLGECFVERHGRVLQIGDARVMNLLHRGHLVEVLDEGCLMHREPILDLDEHELDVGVHGAKDVVLVVRVVERVQHSLASTNLIPNINLSTLNEDQN
jgi:hypothetical protein